MQGASGLVVGDYNQDGLLDFAATGFPGFGVNPEDPAADKFLAVYYQFQ